MNIEPTDDRQRLHRASLANNVKVMIDNIAAEVTTIDRADVIAGLGDGIVQASVAALGAKRTASWLHALARRVEREARR